MSTNLELNIADTIANLARLSQAVTFPSSDDIASHGLSKAPFARDAAGNFRPYEELLARPVRIREQASLSSVTSFIDYVNLHKSATTVILASENANSFDAIIDYHDADGAKWKNHHAGIQLQFTTAMKNWKGKAGTHMRQEDFALFLEENAADIVSPAAAVMIQIATEMRAHKKVDFDSKVNLDNGSFVFGYKEEVKGSFQEGKMEVPNSFQLGITPYKGMPEAYKIDAKLRYKIVGSELQLWFAIPTLDRVLEDAFENVKKQIATGTSVKVYDGSIK